VIKILNATYWESRAEKHFFALMETFEAENNASTLRELSGANEK
jgi:hypothetical protein